MVKIKTHLALFPFNMRIMRPLATEQPDHGLIQEMLCRMRWRELFLIVVVENGGHIHLCFKLQNDSTIGLHIDKDSLIALQ